MEIYVWEHCLMIFGKSPWVSVNLFVSVFLEKSCLFLEWSHFPFPGFRTTVFGNTAVSLGYLFRLSFFCSDFLSFWRCGCNLAFPPAGMRGCTRETDKEREKQNGSIKKETRLAFGNAAGFGSSAFYLTLLLAIPFPSLAKQQHIYTQLKYQCISLFLMHREYSSSIMYDMQALFSK